MPRVCLVTGASSGIGRSTAQLLAARGEVLVLLARRQDVLDDVAELCRAAGAAAVSTAVADVADDAAVARAVDAVREAHGRLDVVVHCAGLVTYGDFTETAEADFRTVLEVNLLGAASVARHTLPLLRDQGDGTLLLVGSVLGHVAVPGMTAYVVSKWGVRALARQLKIENADVRGVRIAYVAPGSVDTPIYDRALDDGGSPSRPPPPTVSPERVAAQVVAHLERRRLTLQTAPTNRALILAYAGLPSLYDRVVGPAFRLLSRRAR